MAGDTATDDYIVDQIMNNYDKSIDDILEDADNRETQNASFKANAEGQGEIPEEMDMYRVLEVKKARKQIPKLDEARLRSVDGIPKLQKIAKTNLKFRGKGHEFADVAMLLGTYQLWLDALHPRSKFADGLVMVEKLGHQKNLQRLRSEWINEGKPKEERDESDSEDNISVAADPSQAEVVTEGINVATPHRSASLAREVNLQAPEAAVRSGFDAHQQEKRTQQQDQDSNSALTSAGTKDAVMTIPDDDELDQLLAEQGDLSSFESEARNSFNELAKIKGSTSMELDEGAFADEEELMREMEF